MQGGGEMRGCPRRVGSIVVRTISQGAQWSGTVLSGGDPRCSFCVALGALPWPEEGTPLRLCPEHLRLSRVLQCRGWNADHGHQVMAGHAAFAAFSARFRAEQGMAPLSADDARRYVQPDMIRSVGAPLPPELQARIHRAWCHGYLYGVLRWIYEPAWAARVDEQMEQEAAGFAHPSLL